MKKYLIIIFVIIAYCSFSQNKKEPEKRLNFRDYNTDPKYKPYIDTINSWDFRKEVDKFSIMDSNTTKIFNALNEYRKSMGLPELKYYPIFSLASKIQSYYCRMVMGCDKIGHDNHALKKYTCSFENTVVTIEGVFKMYRLDQVRADAEIINSSTLMEHMPWIKNCTPYGLLNFFMTSKTHHLIMLDRRYTHVGFYVDFEHGCNTVMIFGIDPTNQNDISKYPIYNERSQHVLDCAKSYEDTYVIINGLKYYTKNNTKKILVTAKNGGMYYLDPPYTDLK